MGNDDLRSITWIYDDYHRIGVRNVGIHYGEQIPLHILFFTFFHHPYRDDDDVHVFHSHRDIRKAIKYHILDR